MNACFFEAIARIPLGVASTIEFIGPLLVAVAGSTRRLDLGCALLAGAGVALLGKRLVGGAEPLPVLTFTLSVAAAVLAAPALSAPDAAALWDGSVVATGLAVAALASAIPYLLELLALRVVSAATFSILLSLEPAIAALIGLVVLAQALGAVEVAAIGCVVVASAAAARGAARRREPARVR